jgi:hypothetical protein
VTPAEGDQSPTTPLIFILPEDRTATSGGNLYNGAILEALEHNSIEVHALSLADACSRLEQGMPGLYLVDSLLLRELPKLDASKYRLFAALEAGAVF